MTTILFFLAALAAFSAVAMILTARSAAHEIEGAFLLLVAAILFGSGAVVRSVNALARHQTAARPVEPDTAAPTFGQMTRSMPARPADLAVWLLGAAFILAVLVGLAVMPAMMRHR